MCSCAGDLKKKLYAAHVIVTLCHVAAVSDTVYQLLANGRWFSPGTPASSTTKTGRHDIAESGVAHNKSNHINQINVIGYIEYSSKR